MTPRLLLSAANDPGFRTDIGQVGHLTYILGWSGITQQNHMPAHGIQAIDEYR